MRRHGALLPRERIEAIADALDDQGFLDSARFAERRAAVDREFLGAPTRAASHAGGAYPAEPGVLHRTFDAFFSPPGGPGLVDGAGVGSPRVRAGIAPEDDPRVPRFLEALDATIAASRRRVALVAGADLAHVGPRFGDPEPVSADDLERIGREDREMLAAVEAADAGAFFESVARDDDRRRICGLAPIYALLRALGGGRGALRRYAQWPDPQGVVTFASVIFE